MSDSEPGDIAGTMQTGTSSTPVSSHEGGQITSQLASLVPSFDPATDNVEIWASKIELLQSAWPQDKMLELATRIVLNCKGTAYQKLQLHSKEVLTTNASGIKRLVQLVGGTWGQVPLEKRYDLVEKAVFRCQQRHDETSDSFLSRCVKRDKQLRTYDHTAFVMEEQADDPEGTAEAFWTTDDIDDETLEAMAAEDEDAALILQFEDAMADTIQNDSDLTAFYSTYQDARRRLSERVRVRGFWPIRKGEKGKTKAFKGKGKGKSRPGSLAHRIANSYCRICFQKGHWKDECPKKTGSGSSNPAAAPTSFVVAHEIPSEIQHLPVLTTVAEEARHCGSVVSRRLYKVDNQYRNRGNVAHNRVHMSDRINKTGIEDSTALKKTYFPKKDKEIHNIASRFVHGLQLSLRKTQPHPGVSEDISVRQSSVPDPDSSFVECHFASVGTVGVVDLGASQTVIGSNQVPDLLAKLEPTIRKQVHRTSCNLVFRFGNHQTLTSHHALMLPLHGEWFRIAVVPGQTPFLLSSQFLKQTLKAVIDTDAGTLWSKTLNKHIPLIASNKNLFLLDLNHLWESDRNPLSFMCSDEQVQESTLTHQPSPSERDWKNHECKSGVCSDKDKTPKVVEDTEVQDTISSGARVFKHDHMTMTSNSLPSDQDRVSPIEFPSAHHVDTLPKIQGVQEAVHRNQWRTSSSRCESDGLGRTLQTSDNVWDHPRWQNLSGDVRKPHLDTMVPVQLRNLKQGGSCQVLPVLRAEARHGDGTGFQDAKTKGYKSGKGKMPKSKPMPAAPTEKSWTHVEPEELCSEVEPDLVDIMEGNTSLQMLQMDDQVQAIRSENLHLSNRMNHVEMALQEILNHLKNTHLKSEP
eukprot:symbB.v1.2.019158.t1/scaffold1555.1/size186957/12